MKKRDSKQPNDISSYNLPKREKVNVHPETYNKTMVQTTKPNIKSGKKYPITGS